MRAKVILALIVCVCPLAAASATTAKSVSPRCSAIFWRTGRDGDQRCPRTHSLIADISYADLHWTKWTRREAVGYGDELEFDDAPGPQAASMVQPITISLTRPVKCDDGRWIYTRITRTLYARKRAIALNARVPLLQAKGPVQSRGRGSYGCSPTSGVG